MSLGFTPEGVNNWVALMGWGVAEDDVMTVEQMVDRFSIDSLTASPAAINFQKLDHFNATHIRLFTTEDLAARIKPYFTREGLNVNDEVLLKIIPLIRERLVTLDDCIAFGGFFFKEEVTAQPRRFGRQRIGCQAIGADRSKGVSNPRRATNYQPRKLRAAFAGLRRRERTECQSGLRNFARSHYGTKSQPAAV